MIYRHATKFGGRPYTYICPELRTVKARLSIDYTIEMIGLKAELRDKKEAEKKAKHDGKEILI